MSRTRLAQAVTAVLLAALLACALAGAAAAAEGEGEGVEWRLEQPSPPPPPVGVQGSSTAIGLGHVGDLEFIAPNRGLLITAGSGNTISPGLWAYNGHEWHQLSTVCGATDGRIAWAAAEEFWTVSDGRPGQANGPTGTPAPLADRTLCHFAHGEVVGSYASPAFQESSYQAMHAAACISSTDCWFGGEPLPEREDGDAFHLHWNGGSLLSEPTSQGHTVEDMRLFDGRLFESVSLLQSDVDAEEEIPFPYALRAINSGGTPPFELVSGVPLYSAEEFPQALSFLHLGADEAGLWVAAGPVKEAPAGSTPATLTVSRFDGRNWTQIIGPEASSPSAGAIADDVVNGIAPEPGTDGAWLALDSQEDAEQVSPTASAVVAHVTGNGIVETQSLPSAVEVAEGVGPKGAAAKITCPAVNDCWMTTTQGWLFHLAPTNERQLALDESSAFAGLITFRPADAGLPQVTADAPPPDDSGELPATVAKPSLVVVPEQTEAKVRQALLSGMHTRLVHGTTLELRFHLAVKARVKLIALRKKVVVAHTATRTLAGGNRKLLLGLNRRRWPTALKLQTHALAPLPFLGSRAPSVNSVGTRVTNLPGLPSFAGSGWLTGSFQGTLP